MQKNDVQTILASFATETLSAQAGLEILTFNFGFFTLYAMPA